MPVGIKASDQLTAEYDAAGNMLRRYIHGMGEDDPLFWFAGAATTDAKWFHADRQDSIVAMADNGGNVIEIEAYDEYGVPGGAYASRFQYTGQAWIPELGMYYYKARIYSPTLGRFMQTDQIGYADQVNLYAYVSNDPLNRRDPTGLRCKISKTDRLIVIAARIMVTARKKVAKRPIRSIQRVLASRGVYAREPMSRRKTGCLEAGDNNLAPVVDRVGDAHSSIFTAAAASQRLAGNAAAEAAIGKAAFPAAMGLSVLSEGYGAMNDHANGMTWGRSLAIHGGGVAGGYYGGELGAGGGFLIGEAIFPAGGGIVGAVAFGAAGASDGGAWGEELGAAGASALNICR